MATQFHIIRAGDMLLGEVMCVGIVAHPLNANLEVDADATVSCRILKDWTRIMAAFPKIKFLKEHLIETIESLKTFKDFEYYVPNDRIYKSFIVGDVCICIRGVEETLDIMEKMYLMGPV
jgi:hypothetical protein